VAEDPAMRRAVAFLVSVGLDKTVRLNITARESQVEAIDQKADEAGMTRSAYMVRAALAQWAKAICMKATGAQKRLGRSTQLAPSKSKRGSWHPIGPSKPQTIVGNGRRDSRSAQASSAPNRLKFDSLDFIKRNLILGAIIELRSAGRLMRGNLLRMLQGATVLYVCCNAGRAKSMAAGGAWKDGGQRPRYGP
jgi:mobilization protein NikA